MPSETTSPERFDRGWLHDVASWGDKIAVRVTDFASTWGFLFLNVLWWVLWIFVLHIETFPFGLLTMLLSLEAIALTDMVMIVARRTGARDRLRDDQESAEVSLIVKLIEQNSAMNVTILTITQQNAEMLGLLRDILAETKDAEPADVPRRRPALRAHPGPATSFNAPAAVHSGAASWPRLPALLLPSDAGGSHTLRTSLAGASGSTIVVNVPLHLP